MPIASTDEQTIKGCPALKIGATQAETEIHKAMVNNWRTKIFLSWQAMQNLKLKEPPE
jgi:hypothetical protein